MQRLDVTDFATPVNTVDALRVGDGTRLVIAATRRLRAARLPVRQHLHDRNQAGREAAAGAAGPEGIHRRAPDPELPGHRDARRAAAAGGHQRPEHGHQRHGRRQRHAAPAERAVGSGARHRHAHQGSRHAPGRQRHVHRARRRNRRAREGTARPRARKCSSWRRCAPNTCRSTTRRRATSRR